MSESFVPRVRAGAVALGLSALLLAAFPLIRPFFRLDPRVPAETLAVASPAITSASWVFAHLLLIAAFVLLLFGLLALYARLAAADASGSSAADDSREPRALRALVWSMAGIALILPMLGVEAHALPILGALYLDGVTGVAPAIRDIYRGSPMIVLALGLVALAVGAIRFARLIWRTPIFSLWAGLAFATGLALWFPAFPRPIRVCDGLLIGVGGAWLAWDLWRDTGRLAEAPRPARFAGVVDWD